VLSGDFFPLQNSRLGRPSLGITTLWLDVLSSLPAPGNSILI